MRLKKLPLLFLCSGLALHGADPAKQQRKLKEDAAKKLVKEGEEAEHAGHAADARRSYLAAEAKIFSKDAEKGLERLDAQNRKRVRALLIDANRAWDQNDFAAAGKTLTEAEQTQPGNATVLYDQALVQHRTGHWDESEKFLVRAVGSSANEATRLRLVGLLGAWRDSQPEQKQVMPVSLTSLPAEAAENVNKSILAVQGRWLSSADRDELDLGNPCAAVNSIAQAPGESGALRMDRGLCAAMDGKFSQAASVLESATLRDSEADTQRMAVAALMRRLAELPAPQGEAVRQLYQQAFTQLSQQKFAAALATYKKAAEVLPSFAESNHQTALLADALADTKTAEAAWRNLFSGSDEILRSEAEIAIKVKSEREAQYQNALLAARAPLETLLRRHLIDGDLAHKHYALNQMEQCAVHLQEAAAIHPLSPDVQTMGALLAMQRNDFAHAEWHGRSLASAGAALSFYGAVYTHVPGDAKRKKNLPIQFSRIDIARDELRVTELSLYNPRRHKPVPGIGTGQLLWDPATNSGFSGTANIRKLETRDEYIYLELLKDKKKTNKLWIEPLHLALEVPPRGPGARRFANQYTHLVANTVGYDTAKLGKETLTFGERMKLAYDFASFGWETYSAVLNPMGAYDAYRSFRRVTSTISQNTKKAGHTGGTAEMTTFALPFQFVPGATPERFMTELK